MAWFTIEKRFAGSDAKRPALKIRKKVFNSRLAPTREAPLGIVG
jgi:hypothetical protein